MEVASPPSSLPSSAQRTSHVGRRRVGCFQISSRTPFGESRTSALARRPASLGEAAKLTSADRLLWTWLCEAWSDWRSDLVIVKPETVIGWHRKGFRLLGTWKVRRGQLGRPPVPKDVRELIREMCRDNPLWGARASTVNCSNSASTSVRPAWASTSCAVGSRRRNRRRDRGWC
jgi:hypothetical protein